VKEELYYLKRLVLMNNSKQNEHDTKMYQIKNEHKKNKIFLFGIFNIIIIMCFICIDFYMQYNIFEQSIDIFTYYFEQSTDIAEYLYDQVIAIRTYVYEQSIVFATYFDEPINVSYSNTTSFKNKLIFAQ
jgi:hypothetical protein